jgi:hypothetical protein
MNKTNLGSGSQPFRPYRGQSFNRININATCYLKPLKKFSQKLNAGVHIMDQSPDEYATSFSTTDNNNYNLSLFNDQLFKLTWYISYNISF